MIDIHSHILPGVDDGAVDLQESIHMAKAAAQEGIHTVIATPHHKNGKYENSASEIDEKVSGLNSVLQELEIPVTVLIGQEIRYYPDLLDDLHNGTFASLNRSRYILIEFPSNSVPRGALDLFHELKVQQLVPIIAHPERNADIMANTNLLAEMIDLGALSQITSHSLTGRFGKKIQSLSVKLCRDNLVHLIASDAHDVEYRPFALKEACSFIDKTIGEGFETYFLDNAKAVVADENIEIIMQMSKNRKKWFKFW